MKLKTKSKYVHSAIIKISNASRVFIYTNVQNLRNAKIRFCLGLLGRKGNARATAGGGAGARVRQRHVNSTNETKTRRAGAATTIYALPLPSNRAFRLQKRRLLNRIRR